jgi:hypothetical protein
LKYIFLDSLHSSLKITANSILYSISFMREFYFRLQSDLNFSLCKEFREIQFWFDCLRFSFSEIWFLDFWDFFRSF